MGDFELYTSSFQALEDELNYAQQVIECSKLIKINKSYEYIFFIYLQYNRTEFLFFMYSLHQEL